MNGRKAPDLILHGGKVAVRQSKGDPVEAVAIGRGRIVAVGSDREIFPMAAAETETIDLGGRLVVPGFTDTHIHFYEWALKRRDLKLEGLGSLEELLETVQRAGGKALPGQWIMGQGWNETDWSRPVMPTRETLDQAAPNHPVLLWRCDLHLAVANSEALRLAGIDGTTPDPPEGRIEHDGAGQPNGILRELAINLVRQAVAVPERERIMNDFEEAAADLHRRGITGIHDIRLMEDEDGARALNTFQQLDRENRLKLRSWVSLPGHKLEEIIDLGLHSGFGNERLRIGHVKFFTDGGVGARTAWMVEPYLDAEYGMPLMYMADLARKIDIADRAGLSVMAHAVGDRANRELVTIFEELFAERAGAGRPAPAYPHRIEHVQVIRPADIERLRRLPLALCVTPCNMVLDINLIDTALGERGAWAYNFRQLMDTGVPVMFSSDCPVCDPDPLSGINAAVTRQRQDGSPDGGWYPEARVSPREALDAYTVTPAAVHGARDLGIIAEGARADLVVLSDDLLSMPPADIAGVEVDLTIFDGEIVFDRQA